MTARARYKLVQAESAQEQSDSNAQQGVHIASLIFWSCCAIAAASLAHRTRQSYAALVRHNSQATECNWALMHMSSLMLRCQVHPIREESAIAVESRIISAPAYGHVPMTHASVPIGIVTVACAFRAAFG
jgi:hypothetical protein